MRQRLFGRPVEACGRVDLLHRVALPRGELAFAVEIALPAPAMEKLDQMGAPAIGKCPPFAGSLLECRGGSPLRHGNAVRLSRESRRRPCGHRGAQGGFKLSKCRIIAGCRSGSGWNLKAA